MWRRRRRRQWKRRPTRLSARRLAHRTVASAAAPAAAAGRAAPPGGAATGAAPAAVGGAAGPEESANWAARCPHHPDQVSAISSPICGDVVGSRGHSGGRVAPGSAEDAALGAGQGSGDERPATGAPDPTAAPRRGPEGSKGGTVRRAAARPGPLPEVLAHAGGGTQDEDPAQEVRLPPRTLQPRCATKKKNLPRLR